MNAYRFGDLQLGLKASFDATITAEMMNAFLKTTGDTNPLHSNDEYARASGFEGRVVYGMLTASFYSTLVGVHLPGERCLFQSVSTTFNSPVFVGQKISVAGEVVYLNEAFKQVEIAATISSPEGRLFSKAKIKVGVRE